MHDNEIHIGIAGINGFVGSSLMQYFLEKGYKVSAIPREIIFHDTQTLITLVEKLHVIINVAGASISKPWSKQHKLEMQKSRVLLTHNIVEAINAANIKPSLLINASAIGIYSDKGAMTEDSTDFSNDFLGDLCQKWENEALKAQAHVRVCILRFGIILGKNGGMLKTLLPLFKMGLGAVIGNGKQMFSWIYLEEIHNIVQQIIENKSYQGIYNICSPQVVSNKEFSKILSKTLKKPLLFRIPSFIIRLVFGERAIILLKGQHAIPMQLHKQDYKFQHAELTNVLKKCI